MRRRIQWVVFSAVAAAPYAFAGCSDDPSPRGTWIDATPEASGSATPPAPPPPSTGDAGDDGGSDAEGGTDASDAGDADAGDADAADGDGG